MTESFYERNSALIESYNDSIDTMSFHPDWAFVRSKVGQKAFFMLYGIPHARLRNTATSETIIPELLHQPCVLKLNQGTMSVGVQVLEPVDDDKWRDLRTGRIQDLATIQQRMAGALQHQRWWDDLWLIEDTLQPASQHPSLCEYKCFCFGGKPEVILGHRAHGGRAYEAYFEPTGKMIHGGVGLPNKMLDDEFPVPTDWAALVDFAEWIAKRFPRPYCRVDVYDTVDGYVAAEINMTDGYLEWGPEWDARLGAVWAKAERQVRPKRGRR